MADVPDKRHPRQQYDASTQRVGVGHPLFFIRRPTTGHDYACPFSGGLEMQGNERTSQPTASPLTQHTSTLTSDLDRWTGLLKCAWLLFTKLVRPKVLKGDAR